MRLTNNYQPLPIFRGAYFDRKEAEAESLDLQGGGSKSKHIKTLEMTYSMSTKDGIKNIPVSVFVNNSIENLTLDRFLTFTENMPDSYAYDQPHGKHDLVMRERDKNLKGWLAYECWQKALQQFKAKSTETQIKILKKQGINISPAQTYLLDAFIKGEPPREPS
jgi:hypothetical protein